MARRVQLAVVAAALLAAVGLPSLPATAAAGQAPPSAPVTAKHAQAHQATAELTAMGRAVLARVRVPADVAPSLVPASRWRRDALLSIARSNPVGIADLLLPDDMLAALGAIPGNELEKKVRLRGTYSLEHREDAQGQATFTPHVVTGSGRVTVVFSDGKLPTARTGADIEVDAYQLDPQTAIAHAAGSTTTTTATSSATSTPTPLGPMGVAVILANFSDSSTSLDANVPKAAFQGSPGSDINSWYSENSYGKASLNASFFGPYTIADATSSGACPDLGVAGGHLLTKASPYLTYSRYRRIIMIFNCTGYGASTSVGEAPLSTPQGTIMGAVTYMDANSTSDRYVFAHELAHNLGNLHAAFFACQPSALIRAVSIRLSMVPSGLVWSHRISPWKPVTRAIASARPRMEMSLPVPTLRCGASE